MEEEILKSSIATFIFCPSEVFSSEDSQVDGAMPQHTGKQQSEALETSKVEIER